eukprot:6958971-Pyramimonas_sp.AAC.1
MTARPLLEQAPCSGTCANFHLDDPGRHPRVLRSRPISAHRHDGWWSRPTGRRRPRRDNFPPAACMATRARVRVSVPPLGTGFARLERASHPHGTRPIMRRCHSQPRWGR